MSHPVRRQDTTKGPPLRILSLDGGGVRGYSIFILLQELMHRTYVEMHGQAPKRHEIPKPCDHFDLIVGTGTGGLIAIMLGRLRMDLDTCKDVYVRMTRRVFETDKRIAGIPYRSTLFKASKLEEAIRDCVKEHTVFEDEGNDTLASAVDLTSPTSPGTPAITPDTISTRQNRMSRSMSGASRQSSILSPGIARATVDAGRFGNPDALLYDVRENRTKTAVTAVYKGSRANAPAALLRSYDSRREPAPEHDCTIWEAGRATTAIGVAFKPIQVGQSIFIDEGKGRFNPSPQVLDEAVLNEYPGRDIGVFISIGTGKRPSGTDHQQAEWWESFMGGSFGDFAEARRRLITKIEGCEETHQYMLREKLRSRGVDLDNYYRLNVEVGVGEFAMNEWNRLTDISTNTRMYLSKVEVQNKNAGASKKMARIHNAKQRLLRSPKSDYQPDRNSWQESVFETNEVPGPSNPYAVELPADEGFSETRPASQVTNSPSNSPRPQYGQTYNPPKHYERQASVDDKFTVLEEPPKRPPKHPIHQQAASDQYPQVADASYQSENPLPLRPHPHVNTHYRATSSETPVSRVSGEEYRQYHYQDNASVHSRTSTDSRPQYKPSFPEDYSYDTYWDSGPAPPLPPKTPLSAPSANPFGSPGRPPGGISLPYPDSDGPPPAVNMARKPQQYAPR